MRLAAQRVMARASGTRPPGPNHSARTGPNRPRESGGSAVHRIPACPHRSADGADRAGGEDGGRRTRSTPSVARCAGPSRHAASLSPHLTPRHRLSVVRCAYVRRPTRPTGGGGPAAASTGTGTRPAAYFGCVAIWIRLPQVSSKTAVVTGPISRGSWMKRTPRSRRRSYSAFTSSTANWASGMPSLTSVSR